MIDVLINWQKLSRCKLRVMRGVTKINFTQGSSEQSGGTSRGILSATHREIPAVVGIVQRLQLVHFPARPADQHSERAPGQIDFLILELRRNDQLVRLDTRGVVVRLLDAAQPDARLDATDASPHMRFHHHHLRQVLQHVVVLGEHSLLKNRSQVVEVAVLVEVAGRDVDGVEEVARALHLHDVAGTAMASDDHNNHSESLPHFHYQ